MVVGSGNGALGNGMMDENENKVKDVKVELLNNGALANLYTKDEPEGKEAKTITNEEGKYSFAGVIPGNNYCLRFTYGNGEQYIKGVGVNAIDYKSTIISKDVIQNAMESDTASEWYKKLDNENYSTAVDDLSQRSNEEQVYTIDDAKNNKNNAQRDINAYTPKTIISIENTELNAGQENRQLFGGFNFGIITFPKTDIPPDKKISDITIINQVGTVMTSGDPVAQPKYISDVEKQGKSIRAELDPNVLYGSELKTTYQITIENKSNDDYYEPEYIKANGNEGKYIWDTANSKFVEKTESSNYSETYNKNPDFGKYYKYGEQTATSIQRTVQIEQIGDYIDDKYSYDDNQQIVTKVYDSEGNEDNNDITEVKIQYKENSNVTEEEKQQNEDGTETTNTKHKLEITGLAELAPKEKQVLTYVVTSKLFSTSEDLTYTNAARIEKIRVKPLIEVNMNAEWFKSKTTIITITPNTGKDKSNTYWIAGTIALIVLGAGFVILKKKVLK